MQLLESVLQNEAIALWGQETLIYAGCMIVAWQNFLCLSKPYEQQFLLLALLFKKNEYAEHEVSRECFGVIDVKWHSIFSWIHILDARRFVTNFFLDLVSISSPLLVSETSLIYAKEWNMWIQQHFGKALNICQIPKLWPEKFTKQRMLANVFKIIPTSLAYKFVAAWRCMKSPNNIM